MNRDWQLITETIDGDRASYADSTLDNGDWEIVVPQASECVVVL